MLLQQIGETYQCGGVWHVLDGQVDTDEVTHGLTVIDDISQGLVDKRTPLLEGFDP